jgi:hypothetical protein
MVSFHTAGPRPVQRGTEAERARRHRFPDVIAAEDRVTFFPLSERALRRIPRTREPHNRLGDALQLCPLRFMGFVPDALRRAPPDAVAFVAHQLAVDPHVLAAAGGRAQTRHEPLLAVQTPLGSRKGDRDDVHTLAAGLLERAFEHDKPTRLAALACEKRRTEQRLRPGVTRLARLGAATRARAQGAPLHPLTPMLTNECPRLLETLLAPDAARGMTPLAWRRRPTVSHAPKAMVGKLAQRAVWRATGGEAWSLEARPPTRLTFVAQLARHASAQALQRTPAGRRDPRLGAVRVHGLATGTDECQRCPATVLKPSG